jgi:hypothetical protein
MVIEPPLLGDLASALPTGPFLRPLALAPKHIGPRRDAVVFR